MDFILAPSTLFLVHITRSPRICCEQRATFLNLLYASHTCFRQQYMLTNSIQTARHLQASKDCVQKTLKRLEEKISGRVLRHLLYLLRSTDKETQRRVAIALVRFSTTLSFFGSP